MLSINRKPESITILKILMNGAPIQILDLIFPVSLLILGKIKNKNVPRIDHSFPLGSIVQVQSSKSMQPINCSKFNATFFK